MKIGKDTPEVHATVEPATSEPSNIRGVALLTIGYATMPIHILLDYFRVYDISRNVLIVVPCLVFAAAMTVVGAVLASRSDRAIPLALLIFFIELGVYGIAVLLIFSRHGGY